MRIEKLDREFRYCGVVLPELDSALDLESIRSAYWATFPEITTATVSGPEVINNKLVHTFTKAVGTKG
jgi:PRTRC genetic system protein C